MEQIIPILIAAIVFGFQAYQNYQKEQEKARKRNPGHRPPQQQDGERSTTAETRQSRPTVAREHQPVQQSIPVPEAAPILEDYQEYAGFINEDQLVQLTKKRNKSSQDDLLKPLEVTDDEEEVTGPEGAFDLRSAVIHATILERPYQ